MPVKTIKYTDEYGRIKTTKLEYSEDDKRAMHDYGYGDAQQGNDRMISILTNGKRKNAVGSEENQQMMHMSRLYDSLEKKDKKLFETNKDNYATTLYNTYMNNNEIEQIQNQLKSPILSPEKKTQLNSRLLTLQANKNDYYNQLLDADLNNLNPLLKGLITVGKGGVKAASTVLKAGENLTRGVAARWGDVIGGNFDKWQQDTYQSDNMLSGYLDEVAEKADRAGYNTQIDLPFGIKPDLSDIPAQMINTAMILQNPMMMYGSMASGEYANSSAKGNGELKAVLDAGVKTGIEYLTEKMGGLVPGKKIATNGFTNWIKDVIEEGGEEVASTVLNSVYDNVFDAGLKAGLFDKNQVKPSEYYNLSTKEKLEKLVGEAGTSAIMAGASAGLMTAPSAIRSSKSNKATDNETQSPSDNQPVTELKKSNKKLPTKEVSPEIAEANNVDKSFDTVLKEIRDSQLRRRKIEEENGKQKIRVQGEFNLGPEVEIQKPTLKGEETTNKNVEQEKTKVNNKMPKNREVQLQMDFDNNKLIKGRKIPSKKLTTEQQVDTLQEVSEPTKVEKPKQKVVKKLPKKVAPKVVEEVKPVVKETVKKSVKPVVKKALVKETAKPIVKPVVKETVKPIVETKVKPVKKTVAKVEVKPVVKEAVKQEIKETVKPVKAVVKKATVKPVVKQEVKETIKQEVKKPVVKQEVKQELAKPKEQVKKQVKQEIKETPKTEVKQEVKPVVKQEIKAIEKEVKSIAKKPTFSTKYTKEISNYGTTNTNEEQASLSKALEPYDKMKADEFEKVDPTEIKTVLKPYLKKVIYKGNEEATTIKNKIHSYKLNGVGSAKALLDAYNEANPDMRVVIDTNEKGNKGTKIATFYARLAKDYPSTFKYDSNMTDADMLNEMTAFNKKNFSKAVIEKNTKVEYLDDKTVDDITNKIIEKIKNNKLSKTERLRKAQAEYVAKTHATVSAHKMSMEDRTAHINKLGDTLMDKYTKLHGEDKQRFITMSMNTYSNYLKDGGKPNENFEIFLHTMESGGLLKKENIIKKKEIDKLVKENTTKLQVEEIAVEKPKTAKKQKEVVDTIEFFRRKQVVNNAPVISYDELNSILARDHGRLYAGDANEYSFETKGAREALQKELSDKIAIARENSKYTREYDYLATEKFANKNATEKAIALEQEYKEIDASRGTRTMEEYMNETTNLVNKNAKDIKKALDKMGILTFVDANQTAYGKVHSDANTVTFNKEALQKNTRELSSIAIHEVTHTLISKNILDRLIKISEVDSELNDKILKREKMYADHYIDACEKAKVRPTERGLFIYSAEEVLCDYMGEYHANTGFMKDVVKGHRSIGSAIIDMLQIVKDAIKKRSLSVAMEYSKIRNKWIQEYNKAYGNTYELEVIKHIPHKNKQLTNDDASYLPRHSSEKYDLADALYTPATKKPKERLNSEILAQYKVADRFSDTKGILGELGVHLIDQARPLINLDRKFKSNAIRNAYTRNTLAKSEGLGQVNVQTDIDSNTVGVGIGELSSNYSKLNANAQRAYNYRAHLIKDIYNAKYHKANGTPYVDNIFPEFTLLEKMELLSKLDNAYPSLARIQEQDFTKIREFNKNERKFRVDSGLEKSHYYVSEQVAKDILHLSKPEIKLLEKNEEGYVRVGYELLYDNMNPYYFHSTRLVHDQEYNANDKSTGISKAKSLKENAEKYELEPMYDSMALWAYSNRVAGRKNMLYKTVGSHFGSATNEGLKSAEINSNIKTEKNPDGIRTISFYDHGVLATKEVPRDVFASLSQSPSIIDELASDKIGTAIGKINSVEKQILTTFNPEFLLKNVMRDAGEGILFSKYGTPSYIKEYVGILGDINSNSDYWQEYKNTGMFGEGVYGLTTKTGIIEKKGIANKIEKVSNYTEALARFTEYKLARKHGETIDNALRQAKNITCDFSRGGKLFKSTDKVVTKFLAPAQAGVNKMIDAYITDSIDAIKAVNSYSKGTTLTDYEKTAIKKSGRLIAKTIGIGLVAAAFNGLVYNDDEEKDFLASVPQNVKDNSYIIRIGKTDKYISIPMSRVVGLWNKVSNIATSGLVKEEDRQDVLSILTYFNNNIAPSKISDSVIGSQLAGIINNKNYYGNEIYKAKDSGKLKLQKSAKYLLNSYGTVLYDLFDYVTKPNKSINDIPVSKQFYKTTGTASIYATRYYKLRDKYDNLDSEDKNKIKFNSYKYDKAVYVDPIKDRINLATKTGASKKELSKLYKELDEAWAEIFSRDDTLQKVDKDTYLYRGYYYSKMKRQDNNTGEVSYYYKKS